MGRRSYSGEKRRKELMRKAKRDAKQERKQQVASPKPVEKDRRKTWTAIVSNNPVAEDRLRHVEKIQPWEQ